VLSQGPVDLNPQPQCTSGDGPNEVNCAKEPSEESHDPLSDLAEDNVEWGDMADSMCDFYDFDITKLDNPSYEYYSPDDVTTVVDPDTGEITKTYTLYPGTYRGNEHQEKDQGPQDRTGRLEDVDIHQLECQSSISSFLSILRCSTNSLAILISLGGSDDKSSSMKSISLR